MSEQHTTGSPIKYGIAGFGRFSQRRLVPAFNLLDSSRITAIQKRDQADADKSAATFNIPCSYGSYQALVNDPEIDAIYITSPNGLHLKQALIAAAAGKHILCEKPMATKAGDCRAIIQICKENRVKLMVAHNLRYSGVVNYLKAAIEENMIGRIRFARMNFTYNATGSPRSWIYDYDLAGGGALIDLGVHCIDTLRFLLGEIETIQSILRPSVIDHRIDDTASLNLTFESSVVGNIMCSYSMPYSNTIEIIGENGRISANGFSLSDTDVEVTVQTADDYQTVMIANGNTYGEMITAFTRAIRGLNPVAIPGEEGLKNQEAIDHIYATATVL